MYYQLAAIPVISAFIGYLTNVVAIKLLFWPQKPINCVFFELFGLLPKRQAEIAVKVGELVEEQLLSPDDLIDKVNTPETQEKITEKLCEIVRDRLYTVLPRILPQKLVQLIGDNLEKILYQEAPGLIEQLIESGQDHINNEIKIKTMVEDKINSLDLDELEKLVRGVSSTELKFIEILGGVLGFIIGLVQIAILLLFPL